MHRYCIVALIGLATLFSESIAQNSGDFELIDSKEVILKGIEHHDNEAYEEALVEYNKVNKYDTNYLWAVYEKSLTLYSLERFEEAEKFARIALNMKTDYVEAYTSLGNALDEQDRIEEALEIYDEGLEQFPYNHLLWLNKGILYEKDKQYDKAFEVYKQLLEFNPMFASTHLRIGLMCIEEGRISQGLMALTTFLMLEPNSNRSLNILSWMSHNASGGNKELGSSETRDLPDEMSDIDFLVNNKVALNKKYKVPSKFSYDIIKQDHLIFEQCMESSGDGFWWDFYVPIYKKLMQEERFETFSLYLLASSTDSKVQKKVSKKLNDIKAFRGWFLDQWYDQHKGFKADGKDVTCFYYDNAALLAFADATEDGNPTGDALYFFVSGTPKSTGKLDDQSRNQGEWVYFYETGDTLEIAEFKDDELNGSYRKFYKNGKLSERAVYKEGLINGKFETFYASGAPHIVEEFVDGKPVGEGKRYYPHGQLNYEYNREDGLLQGVLKEYYPSGVLDDERPLKDNEIHGERKQYHANGQLGLLNNYEDGVMEGPYESYHENGQLSSKGIVAKDSKSGDWVFYFSDGTVKEKNSFDENGKINGTVETFGYDGKILERREYQRSEMQEYKIFDADGNVIHEEKEKKGELYVRYYTPNRVLESEGVYEDGEAQGTWKYYFNSGAISYEKNYKDNELHGDYISYFSDGSLDYKLKTEEGNAQGLYEEYTPFGLLEERGNYLDDEQWGIWSEYFGEDLLLSETYYTKGERKNDRIEYRFNGNPKSKEIFNDEAQFCGFVNYDTLGQVIDSVYIEYGFGKVETHYPSGQVRWRAHYLNGKAHGDFTWYFPNGQIETEGAYEYGSRVGVWKWYYPNGKIETEGEYESGDKVGTWKSYHMNGNQSRSSEYKFGDLHGLDISYYQNGSPEFELELYEGLRHGESRYYGPEKELKIVRYYSHGLLTGYSYEDQNGTIKPMIPVENETAEVVAFYSNGKKSVEYAIENDWFTGPFLHYLPNGELMIKAAYKKDELDGERTEYFANGAIEKKYASKNGRMHGDYVVYYPNGKKQITGTYKYGEEHGVFRYYDQNGKEIAAFIYDSGNLFENANK